jgi:hypothetical protein
MGGGNKQRETFDRVAAQKRADLTREQWTDYQERFKPWEQKLVDFASDPTVKARSVEEASAAVDSTYATGLGQFERNSMRMGGSGQLNAAENRSMDLSKVTSKIQAVNDAKRYADDRSEKIKTQGLGATARGN